VREHGEYAYRAARPDGTQETGVVDALSRDAAAALLAHRNLFAIELRLKRRAAPHQTRVPQPDLALALRMLATLLESGLPIGRALAALEEVAPTSWKTGFPAVREAIREGKSLSKALRESTLSIPPLVVGIIQAGEAGSGVPGAVRRASELVESSASLRSAVRNALAYPAILACAGTASLGLLIGVVLPRFGVILADLGQTLPASTRLVLGLAEIAKAGVLPGIVVSAVLAMVWRFLTSTERGLIGWHELLLSLPVVGSVRRATATARAAAAVSALLESGVAIAPALKHAAPTAGDAAIAARLAAARESIITGNSIARSFEDSACMTQTAIRLVRTGEETGQLAAMLHRVAIIETERTGQLVRTAVRLLEPMLILVFSIVVALVAAALLQAVYSLRPVS
jgi:general secretion pathway protein F